ncbi:Translin [Dendrothele bispora CBS 962.96]|uniref:Translin n=1 Tax=Dendrothele bispora (strain CBS 962.96) TaxID=1314807 RepID=A0A4S8MTS4_DENBC|nr:Translin [Dendrothele bispora CBS 962.96]
MSFLPAFQSFRDELDDHNDRRERLIKASRDITNIAKKTIFLLHRVVLESENPFEDRSASRIKAAKQGREKLNQVQEMYASLRHELVGDRYWRYQRQVSPGLQEYIEALSFAHFLEHSTLITFQQVQDTLCDADGNPYFPLTISDYLLGASDLTGELMRFAISGFGKRGGRSNALDVCAFVRNCKADFERFTPYVRDLSKKQSVTAESLVKIEDAAYAAVVRSSEYDLSPDMLDDLVTTYLSNQNSETRRSDRWRDEDRDDDTFS